MHVHIPLHKQVFRSSHSTHSTHPFAVVRPSEYKMLDSDQMKQACRDVKEEFVELLRRIIFPKVHFQIELQGT